MPTRAEYAEAYARLGQYKAVAREFGVNESSVRRALTAGAPMQAAKHMIAAGGDPSQIAGGWLMEYDDDGRKLGSHRYRVDPSDTLAERIAEVLAEIRDPLPPLPPPEAASENLLNLLALPDWHLLMQAWGRETGESYDVNKARAEMQGAADRLFARARPAQTAVVLGLGDQFHVKDDSSRVGRGGHQGQVDGRISKGFHIALWSFVYVIRRALEAALMVKVRILPGNHDEHMAPILAEALAAFFHDEPRVAVDLDQSYWWRLPFGRVFLAGTHGDNIRNRAAAASLASYKYRREIAHADHCFLFTGHLHHEKTADTPGWLHVQLRAMTAADAHAAMSFLTPREVTCWTFHRDRGRQDVLHEPLPLMEPA